MYYEMLQVFLGGGILAVLELHVCVDRLVLFSKYSKNKRFFIFQILSNLEP